MKFQAPTRDFMKCPWHSRPQRRVKIQRTTMTTMAARPPDVQRHTGAEYEAGRVHRHLMNEEQPIGGLLRTGGGEPTAPGASPTRHRQQNAEQMDLGLGLGDCNSPAHSTQASVGEKSAEPSPRDVRAAALLRARQLVTTRTTSLPHSASRGGAGRQTTSKECRKRCSPSSRRSACARRSLRMAF